MDAPSLSIRSLKAFCCSSARPAVSAYAANPPTSRAMAPAIRVAGFAAIIAFKAVVASPAPFAAPVKLVMTLTTDDTGPLTALKVLKAATTLTTVGIMSSILPPSLLNTAPTAFKTDCATFRMFLVPDLNVLTRESRDFFAGFCISFGRSFTSPSHRDLTMSFDATLSCILFLPIPFTKDLTTDTEASIILGADCATFVVSPASMSPASSTAASNPPCLKASVSLLTSAIPLSAAFFKGSCILSYTSIPRPSRDDLRMVRLP